ncbi:hypothetical protein FH972_025664 [Carpinus fangiana]|uniref:FAD dependent oxidoreductase domain-containing protein n=1 Tax=Carpinus fangiana TaxID=176857 RepID=A0A5N6L495_9ROSI|nr:hypothetical protein FH972_025664 [Carpinus fangiana]
MDARARVPPGVPRLNPTVSYWQSPPAEIATFRSTEDLPTNADYVIVGSGISGACIAHGLLMKRPDASVIMLEARTACSGATGRNGGHTKAASYRTFLEHQRTFGTEEAVKIAQLEHQNIKATEAFAKLHNIDCDIHPCETADVFVAENQWQAALEATKTLNAASACDVETYTIHSASEAQTKFLTPGAIGGITYCAGSISAYKLTIGILKLALEKGLNLQTNTPAISLCSVGRTIDNIWQIATPRGHVTSPNVILATNGYSAHFLPELQGVIVPLRGHCTAQRPGMGLPKPALPMTYSFFYEAGYEYMISRPIGSKGQGDIIIGGGRTIALPNEGLAEFGETNDTVLEPALATYLHGCAAEYFGRNWGRDHSDGREKTTWSGIMGISADGLPYVGSMPGKEGVWISAGFNGHGMVMCLKSAEGLVNLMLDGDVATWFPRSFLMSEDRLKQMTDCTKLNTTNSEDGAKGKIHVSVHVQIRGHQAWLSLSEMLLIESDLSNLKHKQADRQEGRVELGYRDRQMRHFSTPQHANCVGVVPAGHKAGDRQDILPFGSLAHRVSGVMIESRLSFYRSFHRLGFATSAPQTSIIVSIMSSAIAINISDETIAPLSKVDSAVAGLSSSPTDKKISHRRTSSSVSGVFKMEELMFPEEKGQDITIPIETQQLGWKINTPASKVEDPEVLKKFLINPPVKKIDLRTPLGIVMTARNMKGVTIKDALDAIYKANKKKASFEWDKEESWESLIIHTKKEAGGAGMAPSSKKAKKKEEKAAAAADGA